MPDRAPLFDDAFARKRRVRAARRFEQADFLYRRVAEDLADRAATANRTFNAIAEIGARGRRLRDAVARRWTAERHVAIADVAGFAGTDGVVGAPDTLPLAEGAFDLILSAFGLHDVDDLPGALLQIRRALKPDGFFCAALPGPRTLQELREVLTLAETDVGGGAGLRVHPFIDVRDAGGLLQRAGFALPVADADLVTVRYDHPIALMRDLRAMGETNALAARPRRALSRAVLERAGRLYADRHADSDGRLRATFEIVHMAGWAPHEGQQKPLAPGSAKTRLADALGAVERPLPDAATPSASRDDPPKR